MNYYFRIEYKMATFTCKDVTLNQLPYLTHLLAPYTPGCSLLSQDKHLLLERAVATVTGSRGFSMQHLRHGMNSLSKFAIARRMPVLRGTLSPCLLRAAPRHLAP